MHRISPRFSCLIFIIFSLTGCVNDELCSGLGTNEVKLAFFQFGQENDTPLSISVDSLIVSGQPSDVYPDLQDSTFSEIGLELNPDSVVTQFILFTNEGTDTLELQYKITGRVISVDCGPELIFSELDTITHTYDSLSILEPTLTRDVETNIKIYR